MDYPQDEAVGLVDGKFTDGDPLNTVPASLDPAAHMNALTDELLAVIAEGGLTPDEASFTQVRDAIKNMIAGADIIARFTTTGNVNLTGLGTQAGGDWPAPVNAGDIGLIKDQDTAAENGWYVFAADAWTRVAYLDEDAEVKPSSLTKVSEGVTKADTMWMLTTDAPIVVGTTGLVFVQQGVAESDIKIGDIVMQPYEGARGSKWMKVPVAATVVLVATYPELAAVYGTDFGGDGIVDFGIPHIVDGGALVQSDGDAATTTIGEVLSHLHGGGANYISMIQTGPYGYYASQPNRNTYSTGGPINAAGGLKITFWIKLED